MSELILEKNEKQNLPNGWIDTVLDYLVLKMSSGTTEIQFKEKTNYPVSRIETISNEFVDFDKVQYLKKPSQNIIDKYQLEKGDILFSNINSDIHLGKTAIFYDDKLLIHGMNLLLIRPDQRIIFPKFLNFYFKHYRNLGRFISISQHAVNQSSINQTKLKSVHFTLPPLNEQKRIIVKIEELFSLIDSITKNLKFIQNRLDIYKNKILISAFDGTLTTSWRNLNSSESANDQLKKILSRKKDKSKLKNNSLGISDLVPTNKYSLYEIPQNWAWCTINTISKQVTDGEHFNPKYCDKGNLLLSAKNIRDGFVSYDDVHYVNDDDFEKCLQRCKPELNDILIVSVGATTGRTAIVKKSTPFVVLRSVLLIKPDSIIPEYLLRYLQSPISSKWLTNASGSTAQAHLYIRDTKNFPFPMAPISEQLKIIEILDEQFSKIDFLNSMMLQKIIQLSKLRQIIIKQAFEGKLVPQDPNDEPASELLKRIKLQN